MEQTSLFVTRDNTDIWLQVLGDGPPLVLCDGLACEGFAWPYLIERLRDHFTLIRWNYPGHGRSPNPDRLDRIRMPNLVGYLREVLDHVGIERALFFGHSMGSQLIFQFFRDYPDMVEGLVPICGNYKYPLDRLNNSSRPKELLKPLVHLAEFSQTRAQHLWSYSAVNDFFLEIAVNFGMNPDLVRQEDLDRYFQHIARMDVDVFLTYLEQISAHNCEPFLPDIDVPTLIIAGEDDPITPVECSREMYQLIPESRLEVISDGTHVAPIERPALVNGLIEDFVTDVYSDRLKSKTA